MLKNKCWLMNAMVVVIIALVIGFVYISVDNYRRHGKDETKDVILQSAVKEYAKTHPGVETEQVLEQVKSEGNRQAVIQGYISYKMNVLTHGNTDVRLVTNERDLSHDNASGVSPLEMIPFVHVEDKAASFVKEVQGSGVVCSPNIVSSVASTASESNMSSAVSAPNDYSVSSASDTWTGSVDCY